MDRPSAKRSRLDVWNGQAFNSLDLATQPQWTSLITVFSMKQPKAPGLRKMKQMVVMVLDMQRVGPLYRHIAV